MARRCWQDHPNHWRVSVFIFFIWKIILDFDSLKAILNFEFFLLTEYLILRFYNNKWQLQKSWVGEGKSVPQLKPQFEVLLKKLSIWIQNQQVKKFLPWPTSFVWKKKSSEFGFAIEDRKRKEWILPLIVRMAMVVNHLLWWCSKFTIFMLKIWVFWGEFISYS